MSNESVPEEQPSENKRGRGRPKGSKNKKKIKTKVIKKKTIKETFVSDPTIDLHLDNQKFTEVGYNIHTNDIINQEPIDDSFYYRGSKNVPVAGAQYEFTAAMIDELKRCKEDVVYFAENFFYIVNLDENSKQKIKLYEAQKRMLLNMVNNRFSVNLASRQSGKSTLLTIFVLWMACFNDDHRAAIVANKETTAINIFKRVRMAYEQLPNYIKPGVKDYGKTGMTLGNDSSIIVSTTTATSIRGESLSTLAIDEVAFIEEHILEEFWSSVIPAISSGKKTKILLVSTPQGTGNKFYEIYSGAENGTLPTWKWARIDWWDRPGRDKQWKMEQIQLLGSEEKFLQEFGNIFLDDASCAVGAAVIERFKQEKSDPIWVSEDKEYTIFQHPDSSRYYVIGVDVGEGIGRAASVAQVLDITDLQNIEQVAIYSSNVIEPFHFANKLNILGNSWGVPPMLIERNNCGAQVIDALYHQHNYEKLASYHKISEKDQYNRTRNIGVLSHTNIKFDGIQNMRYWINHLQTVKINDPETITEFETFVRHPNGVFKKRNENYKDDRIMSLVWALFLLQPELCQQYFIIEEYDAQLKPLKITPNGYWENLHDTYNLKELSQEQKPIIPISANVVEKNSNNPLQSTFGSDYENFFGSFNGNGDDVDSLIEQGYTFL